MNDQSTRNLGLALAEIERLQIENARLTGELKKRSPLSVFDVAYWRGRVEANLVAVAPYVAFGVISDLKAKNVFRQYFAFEAEDIDGAQKDAKIADGYMKSAMDTLADSLRAPVDVLGGTLLCQITTIEALRLQTTFNNAIRGIIYYHVVLPWSRVG